MDNEKVRKDFEKLFLGGNKHTSRRNEVGDYVLPSIRDAYAGWSAAFELMAGKKEQSADAQVGNATDDLLGADLNKALAADCLFTW